MIQFPNAKINIGLNVIKKRPDSFHEISTLFFPIGLYDILEFTELNANDNFSVQFTNTGLEIDAAMENNLVVKAWKLLQNQFNIPPIKIYLHKIIPFGAGLGGGSSDAAFMLSMLNEYFKLGLTVEELKAIAATLGADCAFFIENKPMLGTGKGEILTPVELSLKNLYLLLIYPNFMVNTKTAYQNIIPMQPAIPLDELIKQPVETWKNTIHNDFETTVFKAYPQLQQLKNTLFENGAIYSSMSGSGSSVFGIFAEKPACLNQFANYFTWLQYF